MVRSLLSAGLLARLAHEDLDPAILRPAGFGGIAGDRFLLAAARHGGTIGTLHSFPLAKEDVALIVDESVASADVAAALTEGAGELLESVSLFDVYTGDQVGEGRKSLAFALRFRGDRTLTDKDAAEARQRAVAVAVERFAAVQRA